MDIFNSKSTKDLLNSRLKTLPKRGHGESRRIASALGVSTTLISHILSGERILTPEQTAKLGEYLSLLSLETDYLVTLNQYERAGSDTLKKYWKGKLETIKTESKVVSKRIDTKRLLTDEERAIFYSHPFYSAIRLWASTSPAGKRLEEIIERFELSRPKALKIINFLLSSGLLTQEADKYKMGTLSTHVESNSPHLLRHSANWRLKAIQYSQDLNDDELMFTSPVSLSKNDFEILREKMVLLIKDFLETVKLSPEEEIACFNLDFFG